MYIYVLIETNLNNNDMMYTYHTTYDNLIGKRVLVPFGKRIIEGFVLEYTKKPNDYEVKDIIKVIDETPVLNDELIQLGYYMKKKYLCSLISCYQAMLPSALKVNSKVQKVKEKYLKYIKLNDNIKKYDVKIESQLQIINFLKENKEVLKNSIKSKSSLDKLIKKNIVIEFQKEIYRYNINKGEVKNIILNKEQQQACNKIISLLNKPKTILLYGVTGSGKTEVYIEVIKKVININKTAIILVPEISLTPQITNRFKSVFKDEIAVLHSSLSDGEKYDEYRKIKRGEVKVVIGARSAIFAPLRNLGIIIIDEEHSESYKQENNPRYNTIDIANERSKINNCPIILGSATPKIESFARAKYGYYDLIYLRKRVNNKPLPKVEIIDMKNEIKLKNRIFSSRLKEEIQNRLDKKEQVMILLNRRGYSNYLSCMSCGYIKKCPNCDITLTYHKDSDMLKCHYCGYGEKNIIICPSCKEKSIRKIGFGTEKIEEELNNIFTGVKVIRMDYDTTCKKNAHEKIIADFNEKKYDILVGTQMISKGLNFKDVTLVGVINADLTLNLPNFRSSERTFSLLNQVIGRAGRNDKEGKAIIQTFNPNHYSIYYSSIHDYEGFFENEIKIRKNLFYPPYCFIAAVKMTSKDYGLLNKESLKIRNYLKENLKKEKVLGPSICNLSKVNNIYNFQIIIKYKQKDIVRNVLKDVINIYNNNKINIIIDFDSINL